ncbi:hypothetical protein [Nocardia alni]|uniref:hypothetical protein n=1 Tax=Nocardia alni TaxID=2815723 RepID=UPI001C21DCC7|nr:hypothetical protein [Nocardia alni]
MPQQNAVTVGTIWKRVDGKWTGLMNQVSGASYVEQFPGATDWEKRLAEARQPGGIWIFDGNVSDDPGAGFAIERFYPPSVEGDAIIVQSSTKPPFGQWAELDEWPH